jgi:hypothetical protein
MSETGKVTASHRCRAAVVYLLTELPKGSSLLMTQTWAGAGTFPARDGWTG